MQHRHLVVAVDPAGGVGLEDPPDADHAQGVEFRGPQRAHAGPAYDWHAGLDQRQQLLVADRRIAIEQAVDQHHGARRLLEGRKPVPGHGGRPPLEDAVHRPRRRRQRGPGEDEDPARAHSGGRRLRLNAPSPGTNTLTTQTGDPGSVSLTADVSG